MRAYLRLTGHGTIRVSDFDEQIADAEAKDIDELDVALLPYVDDGGYLSFQFSSSMDFPTEYTSDPVLLAAVESIMREERV
jgi:hypothetical protein